MEAGEHVEAEIENLDEGPRHEPPEPAFGNGELRDDPLCLSRCAGAQAVCESRDFVRREAVEKEVGDDQVVVRVGRLPTACIGLVRAHAIVKNTGIALEFAQHRRAGIDGVNLNIWICLEQAGCKTAVSISENKRGAAVVEFVEEAAAAIPN